jgi:hypothetical protein
LGEVYTVMGRMTFVDLAGSERLKSTKSSGKILQETGSINTSLYVLGKVIAGLSKRASSSDYQKDVCASSSLCLILSVSLTLTLCLTLSVSLTLTLCLSLSSPFLSDPLSR